MKMMERCVTHQIIKCAKLVIIFMCACTLADLFAGHSGHSWTRGVLCNERCGE